MNAVSAIASVVSGESFLCPRCGTAFHPESGAPMANLDAAVNHCLKEHTMQLLHVGQQTQGSVGSSYESTVAVLGQ